MIKVEPVIDHIEITVRDMEHAISFYDKFLPLLGYDLEKRSEVYLQNHEKHVVSFEHSKLGFAITSPLKVFSDETINRRKPGSLHHLAFKVASRSEVDRIFDQLKVIGAEIVSPPTEYPEYTPSGYYALFIKDPEGIKFEFVCYE